MAAKQGLTGDALYYPINTEHPDIAYMLRQEQMSTDDPEIAAVLRGAEEWLRELLSRSEVVSHKSLSTDDPEIAAMLRGEEEWLQELLSRSEVVSHKSLSTDDPEIASMLCGEEEWLQELLSRSEVVTQKFLSIDDPEIAAMLHEEEFSVTSTVCRTNLREKLDRQFKWGTYDKCQGRSLQPHVLSAASRNPGKLVLYCSNWKRESPFNGRLCGRQFPFPMNRFSELSKLLKEQYTDLRMSLARNAASGGSSSEKS